MIAIWLARSARLTDLWIVPAYLLAANLVEYAVHRLLMHRPLWPRAFYKGHTLGHHRAFHHDSMEIGAWPELELVMMPWFSLLLFFIGLAISDDRLRALAAGAVLAIENDAVGIEAGYLPGLGERDARVAALAAGASVPHIVTGRPDATDPEIAAALRLSLRST